MAALSQSRYRIGSTLGQCAAYTTYAAEEQLTGARRREVVIKALATGVGGGDEARELLARTVRAIADVKHPNISKVFGLETNGSETLVVRQYEDGDSLHSVLSQGRLGLDESILILTQLARAMEAAHKCGVVHHNLKPTNVFLSRDKSGKWISKIADFGIRHLIEPGGAVFSTGLPSSLTYSSPEKALRGAADHRSDIWSLGILFYEMLSGAPPFRSSNSAAELLAILKDQQHPVTNLYPDYPAAIDQILGHCLAKDPNMRYKSAGELAADLDALADETQGKPRSPTDTPAKAEAAETVPVPARPARNSERGGKLGWVAVALASLLAGWIASWRYYSPGPEAPRLRKYALAPTSFNTGSQPAISPDGQSIAYVARGQNGGLRIQDFARDQPREIANTAGAESLFWSPDSQWVGFLANGEIKRARVDGKAVSPVCSVRDAQASFSGSWSPDGYSIAFTSGIPGQLFRVAALGGQPEIVLETHGETPGPRFVRYLPTSAEGKSVLLMGPDKNGDVNLYDMATGIRTSLGIAAESAIYSPTGHLLLCQTSAGTSPLHAVEFLVESMKTVGQPFQIRESAAWPSVSNNGTLAYEDKGGPWQSQLVWRDRRGEITGSVGRRWSGVREVMLSPNGREIGVVAKVLAGASDGLWLRGLIDSDWRREAIEGRIRSVVLSYSGDRGLISFDDGGSLTIHLRQLPASRAPSLPVRADDNGCAVTDWSTDGRHIICHKEQKDGTADLWRLTYDVNLQRYRKAAIAESPFDERDGALSPDRRWIAFLSNQSGKHEVYVTPFPRGGELVRISVEGGTQVRWGRDAGELFYVTGQTLMGVTLQFTPDVGVHDRTPLFPDAGLAADPLRGERHYDYSRLEDKFLVASPILAEGGTPTIIRLTENWIEEFRPSRAQE